MSWSTFRIELTITRGVWHDLYSATGPDVFATPIRPRRQFEPDGIAIAVQTLDPAPLDRLGTVEEQRAYYDDWYARRRARRQAP